MQRRRLAQGHTAVAGSFPPALRCSRHISLPLGPLSLGPPPQLVLLTAVGAGDRHLAKDREKKRGHQPGRTRPQVPDGLAGEASSACPASGLGNSPGRVPQLIIKYKAQTRQQQGRMKESRAYKSVLSPWKKGDTKHKASFPASGHGRVALSLEWRRQWGEVTRPTGRRQRLCPVPAPCEGGGVTSTTRTQGDVLPQVTESEGRGRPPPPCTGASPAASGTHNTVGDWARPGWRGAGDPHPG